MYICKGVCNRYRAIHCLSPYYFNEIKRCSVCCIFLRCEGNTCPCCHSKLRLKPRNYRIYKIDPRMRVN